MQIYKSDITHQVNDSLNSIELLKHKLLFFDIETDGLSHKNKIVIIGIILHDPVAQNTTLIQLFNDDYQSEKELLKAFHEICNQHNPDYYISFNGHSFDIPFINARFLHYHIQHQMIKSANIDLLRIAKKNQDLLKITDFKLKTIERYVGISRNDTISGKDSIILYQAYIETKSNQLKDSILLHNYDDILNMIPLLKITEGIQNYKSHFFHLNNIKCYLNAYEIKNDVCIISFELIKPVSLLELQYSNQYLNFSLVDNKVDLKLNVIRMTDSNDNKYLFLNPAGFDMLPFNQLNHIEKQSLLIQYQLEDFRPLTYPLIEKRCNQLYLELIK